VKKIEKGMLSLYDSDFGLELALQAKNGIVTTFSLERREQYFEEIRESSFFINNFSFFKNGVKI